MQTFLPYPDFHKSASVLDRQRLGKQRVEVLQLLKALHGDTTGWRNHPATRMWDGYENALVEYGIAVCDAWIARGYNDSCRAKINAFKHDDQEHALPPWFGNDDFHKAHRSNLLRKHPEYYRQLFEPDLSDDLPYVWPDSEVAHHG